LVASPFQAFESYEAALSQNPIDLNNGSDIEKFLWRQLPAFRNLSLTALITTNQEFFGAERQDDGAIVSRTSDVENNRALTTYRTKVKKICPNAEVTVDRFHVTKIVHEELNQARIDQKKTASSLNAKERAKVFGSFQGSKYTLLKA
jgi:hypothetical protein